MNSIEFYTGVIKRYDQALHAGMEEARACDDQTLEDRCQKIAMDYSRPRLDQASAIRAGYLRAHSERHRAKQRTT